MSSNDKNEYILTTSRVEHARLNRQHNLWLEDSLDLWRRARFGVHSKILEIGSGPGFTTLDLARYLGDEADITAIELSPTYADESKIRLAAYPNVKVITADLQEFDLGEEQFDAVFGRWIWMWLPDPEKALLKILKHLKPGGLITLQEYVDFGSMSLSSDSPIQTQVVGAIMKSFRDAGGDHDIVKRLLPLFEKHGVEIETLEPLVKLIRPAEPFWDWPKTIYETYLPTLQSKNYLTADELKEFKKVWQKAEQTPGSFWIGPTVANVIARKK